MHDPNRFRLTRLTTLGSALLALLVCATPVFADQAAGSDKSWPAFFGRLHVVVLHLPIGLLLGAFAIEFFGLFRRSKGYDVAAAWLFVLGFGSAVVAVVTGLLLGTEAAAKSGLEGSDELTALSLLFADADKGVDATLSLHMWLGVTLMVIAGVAAVLKILAVRKQWPDESAVPDHGGWPLGIARLSLLGIMAAMPLVGHLGGNMTKGPEYLFARAPFNVSDSIVYFPGEAPAAAPVVTASGEVDALPDGSVAAWYAVIQPALNNSCIRCHGTTKKNGGIRLDSLAESVEGEGLDNPVITNGDAQFSALYTVITLPVSHYMYMPPDKPEDAIEPDVVAFIGEWIQNYDGRLEDPDAPKPEGADADDSAASASVPKVDPATIRAIQDAGGSAQSVSLEENPELLTVKFAYARDLAPAAIAELADAAEAIAELDLQGSAFNDAAAQQLPAMPRLTQLNLKDSAITDEGIAALPDLPALARLNLFGTALTDAGLDSLARFESLDKLFVTGTAVTAEGVARLRAALPDTEIYSDHDEQFRFVDEPIEPAASSVVTESPAATGSVNTVCPVAGAPVVAGFTSTFEGQTIGFCCGNCKARFDADPAAFADKLP